MRAGNAQPKRLNNDCQLRYSSVEIQSQINAKITKLGA
jgi:hypothetical protein